MNVNVFVSLVCVFSIILGAFIGIQIFKFSNRRKDKKLEENAKEVLAGKRENKIKIDGQEYDATKFKLRDEDGNEKVYDLMKGGDVVQNGRRKEDTTGIEEIQSKEVEAIDEVSSGSGEKKRDSRIRPVLSRRRRFG